MRAQALSGEESAGSKSMATKLSGMRGFYVSVNLPVHTVIPDFKRGPGGLRHYTPEAWSSVNGAVTYRRSEVMP